MPSGIKNLNFDDEANAINTAVDILSKRGIHAVIVLLHQGGQQCFAPGNNVDALENFVKKHSPLTANQEKRIRRIP